MSWKVLAKKYWLLIVLLLLVFGSFVFGAVGVFTALIFTFLVPGLIGYRFFDLKKHELWAFIPVFSVLVSVLLVYFVSLGFGYSRDTILVCFLALTAAYGFIVYRKGESLEPWGLLRQLGRFRKSTVLIFVLIFLISFGVLYRSVWFPDQYGYVLTGSNWQDTPFHYEIIESLNQGNFPPQTPNYVGTPLTYHYFVDFHMAIVEKMVGYLPSIMSFLNAIFILVFALSVYALARHYGRKVAIVATVIGVFGWGLSYFGLFSALFNGTFNPSTNYIYQFQQDFGLPSIFDNLLQQRPLLMGLPVFALVLALLRDMDDKNRVILAGVLTGLVYQFHSVAFFCCFVVFASSVLFSIRRFRFGYLYFLVPSLFALPFIFSGGGSFNFSISSMFVGQFAKNPFIYYFLNLGVPFILAIVSFVKPGYEYLKLTFLLLFFIPNVLLLTPWVWDMYKFFIFAWVPIAVLSGVVLAKVKWRVVVVFLVLVSVLTSTSVVIYNVGTNYSGASWSEFDVGLWIRDNTPQNSVFLTYYGIHEPPTMIGGRLRVSSYVYWPYGHGEPLDQVNQRERQIDEAYTGDQTQLADVIEEYDVSYVYVGNEELSKYPDCISRFDAVEWLTPIYSEGNLRVYSVD